MQKTRLTLGFSPCPNDCFMFDALIHGKIDTKDLVFEPVIEDVETLNRMAFEGKLDITKLSYHAFAYSTKTYQLLSSGSALGFNCGPLLIAKPETAEKIKKDPAQISSMKVAIPGKYTTANFLMSIAYPNLTQKKEMIFSGVEQAVISGQTELGLIIHENRFTYLQNGLAKISDLGEWWQSETGHPIPLGGIVIKKGLSAGIKETVNRLIKESVQYAFANPASVMDFVKRHAQAMDEEVMRQHINLYVNKYSEDIGVDGKAAVDDIFSRAVEAGLIPSVPQHLMFNENA